MADRIDRNADEPFGGAALIIPPGEEAKYVVLLKLDPDPDAAVFWGEITSRANEAIVDLQNKTRQQTAFRR
jgi:hypothetical protein